MISADTSQMPPRLQRLLESRAYRRIVVFSGAGISADSGIATFRGGDQGLWSAFDPQELATPEAWQRDRALVWAWYEWRRAQVMAAQPHPGHGAVAALQRERGATVVTQNVDDLHERAGADPLAVLHLHGSLFSPRCDRCGVWQPCAEVVAIAQTPGGPPPRLQPPACPQCQRGWIRPGVVWFGEALDSTVWEGAKAAISDCDLLLVVGTSGLVYPAAGLIGCVPADALVVEINPQPGAVASRTDVHWQTTAAIALPLLRERLCATA